MTETDIKHENGRYWVLLPRSGPNKGTYCVMRNEVTHSVTLEGYTDQSIAVARVDYLAKRERTQHDQHANTECMNQTEPAVGGAR